MDLKRMMVLRLSMHRMKEEAAMPPLAVATLERSNLKTPIRDRLKNPVIVPKQNELPVIINVTP